MCRPTRQNTINAVAGPTPIEVLPPNPQRKAIMLCPLLNNGSGVLTRDVFSSGLGQSFTIPAGVTSLVNIYAWGRGGRGDIPDVMLGAGGGGGGEFRATGSIAVYPGTTLAIDVDPGSGPGYSEVTSPSSGVILKAFNGADGAADIGGAGGTGGTGLIGYAGGAGADATLLAGQGGGGGGAAGSFSVGGTATSGTGAAGGGGITIFPYGTGGAGSDGANPAGASQPGGAFGGGAGGSGSGYAGHGGPGGDSAVIIWYYTVANGIALSLSHRQDVSPGFGVLNYIAGQYFPTVITDEHIGNAICLPFWAACSIDGTVFQIVEYSYDDTV